MLTDIRQVILKTQELIDNLVDATTDLHSAVNNLATASDIADDIVDNMLTGELPATAAKAVADANGNNITSTYSKNADTVTDITVNGSSITYTKGSSSYEAGTIPIPTSVDSATSATYADYATTTSQIQHDAIHTIGLDDVSDKIHHYFPLMIDRVNFVGSSNEGRSIPFEMCAKTDILSISISSPEVEDGTVHGVVRCESAYVKKDLYGSSISATDIAAVSSITASVVSATNVSVTGNVAADTFSGTLNGTATSASNATIAEFATSASSATTAASADSANIATSATNAGSAVSAGKIGTATVGGDTRPVYISSGTPVSCGTSLAVSCTYATSAGNATSASVTDKLGTTNVGTSSTPIYLVSGVPTACTSVVATDEKVKTTVATTSKAYITGTKSATATTGELVIDTDVYLDTTAGMLTATTFKGALSGNASTATSAASAGSAVSAASCTGNAATATSAVSAGYAVSAGKVGTTTIGSTTRPVYISSGIPVSCGTSLAVSCTSANSAGYAVSAGTVTGTVTSATNAAYAASADKLGTATVGGAATPIYLNAGTPTACTSITANTATYANSAGYCTGNCAGTANYANSAGRCTGSANTAGTATYASNVHHIQEMNSSSTAGVYGIRSVISAGGGTFSKTNFDYGRVTGATSDGTGQIERLLSITLPGQYTRAAQAFGEEYCGSNYTNNYTTTTRLRCCSVLKLTSSGLNNQNTSDDTVFKNKSFVIDNKHLDILAPHNTSSDISSKGGVYISGTVVIRNGSVVTFDREHNLDATQTGTADYVYPIRIKGDLVIEEGSHVTVLTPLSVEGNVIVLDHSSLVYKQPIEVSSATGLTSTYLVRPSGAHITGCLYIRSSEVYCEVAMRIEGCLYANGGTYQHDGQPDRFTNANDNTGIPSFGGLSWFVSYFDAPMGLHVGGIYAYSSSITCGNLVYIDVKQKSWNIEPFISGSYKTLNITSCIYASQSYICMLVSVRIHTTVAIDNMIGMRYGSYVRIQGNLTLDAEAAVTRSIYLTDYSDLSINGTLEAGSTTHSNIASKGSVGAKSSFQGKFFTSTFSADTEGYALPGQAAGTITGEYCGTIYTYASSIIRPTVNNQGTVGNSSFVYNAMYATTFHGNTSGTHYGAVSGGAVSGAAFTCTSLNAGSGVIKTTGNVSGAAIVGTGALTAASVNAGSGVIKTTGAVSGASFTGTGTVQTKAFRVSSGGSIAPLVTDVTNLGTSSLKWATVYAKTATISTSDELAKTDIEAIPDAILDIWGDISLYLFKYKNSISIKGEQYARIHAGAIAQRIKKVFEDNNLDPTRYGFFCYDTWEAVDAVKDEDGNVIEPAIPAGSEYALRYEEFLVIEAAYQRRRANRLEARVTSLDDTIAELMDRVETLETHIQP